MFVQTISKIMYIELAEQEGQGTKAMPLHLLLQKSVQLQMTSLGL